MKRAREGAAEGAEPGAPRASALRASSGAPPEDDLDEDLYFEEPSATSGGVRTGADCPYLDTINRQNLDFDFEKCCSISLSPLHVYACLVCGKYFQGKGVGSHAHTHALETGHRVFVRLRDGTAWVLPDGYRVEDPALEDVSFALRPRYSLSEAKRLELDPKWRRAADGTTYMPGLVGLNEFRANGYANAVVQALNAVGPLRAHLLTSPDVVAPTAPLLLRRFAELVRKLWNPHAFRGHVAPHEFLRAVEDASGGRFRADAGADVGAFFVWLLDALHIALAGGRGPRRRSIVSDCFRGSIQIAAPRGADGDGDGDGKRGDERSDGKAEGGMGGQRGDGDAASASNAREGENGERPASSSPSDASARPSSAPPRSSSTPSSSSSSSSATPFFMLTLDLPPAPLFREAATDRVTIPQLPIADLLRRYDGVTPRLSPGSAVPRTMRLAVAPPFLAIRIARFSISQFGSEKNPTIVTFPIRGLDLADAGIRAQARELGGEEPAGAEKKHRAKGHNGTARGDERRSASKALPPHPPHPPHPLLYDLVASVQHEGLPPPAGADVAHVLRRAEGAWYAAHDVHVTEVLPQVVQLSEACFQIYQRRDVDWGENAHEPAHQSGERNKA